MLFLRTGSMKCLAEDVISRYPSIHRVITAVWVEPGLDSAARLLQSLGLHYHLEPQIDPLVEGLKQGNVQNYVVETWRRGGVCVLAEATFISICRFLEQREDCVMLECGESVTCIGERESNVKRPAQPTYPKDTIELSLPVPRVIDLVMKSNQLQDVLQTSVKLLYQWTMEGISSLHTSIIQYLTDSQVKLDRISANSKHQLRVYQDHMSAHRKALQASIPLLSRMDTQPPGALTVTRDTNQLILPKLEKDLRAKLTQWQEFNTTKTKSYPIVYANSAKTEFAEVKIAVMNFKRHRFFPIWLWVEMDVGRTKSVYLTKGVGPGLQNISLTDEYNFHQVQKMTLSLWMNDGEKDYQLSDSFQIEFALEIQVPVVPPVIEPKVTVNAPAFFFRSQNTLPVVSQQPSEAHIAIILCRDYRIDYSVVTYAIERLRNAEREVSLQSVYNYLTGSNY